MKIAIIGGTGLLGSNLSKLYSLTADIRCYSRNMSLNVPDRLNNIINFDDIENELDNKFTNWKPDIIINTVAIVNLEFCQNDIKYAKKVNCEIGMILSKIAKKYESYFIHISTDHFFNDNKVLHTEEDQVKLLNNYAISKFEAEKNILNINSKTIIVRTNIIGFRNNNKDTFFEWLLNNLIQGNKINCYENYFTSPIEVSLLGEILIKCYNKKLYGIFNISSNEVISKYDFAIKVADKFLINKELINKVKLTNDENITRALTLGLDVNKIENALNIKMPSIDKVIDSLYNIYKKENKK